MNHAQCLELLRQQLNEVDGRRQGLQTVVTALGCDSGTLHLLGADGLLHLEAATAGIPKVVLDAVLVVPVGKGMAGLAVQRAQPVDMCNLQTNTSGDARPGAKASGMQGAIVVPCMRAGRAEGALGVANRAERTFSAQEIELLQAAGSLFAGR